MLREGDYIQQLVDYIKKNLAKGYTLESLKWALINHQDYSKIAVEKAIKVANEQLAKQAPKINEKPKIKVEVYPLYDKPQNADELNKPVKLEDNSKIKNGFFKKLFGVFE